MLVLDPLCFGLLGRPFGDGLAASGVVVESPGLLAEQGDDGYGEGEDGDNELRHADPESYLGHGATVPSARRIGVQ